jgi:hypothetical protein
MCLRSGCEDSTEQHDPAAIDWFDLEAAAEDVGIGPEVAAEHMLPGAVHMQDHPEEADDVVKDLPLGVLESSDERRDSLRVAYGSNLVDAGVAQDGKRDFAGHRGTRPTPTERFRESSV